MSTDTFDLSEPEVTADDLLVLDDPTSVRTPSRELVDLGEQRAAEFRAEL
ncbi:hypothetical protein ACFQE8_23040 [Salinirubellus sp. GCM10025818]